MSLPTDIQMISAAKEIYEEEGRIEVDTGAKLPTGRVSRGDDPGAYVLAWVWVYDEEAEQSEGKETTHGGDDSQD